MKPHIDNHLKSSGNSEGTLSESLEAETEAVDEQSSPKGYKPSFKCISCHFSLLKTW